MGMQKSRLDEIFEQLATDNGVPASVVVHAVQNIIDATWDDPDPVAREKQRKLFPNGKPTIEEFIRVTATQSKQRYDLP